MRIVSWNVNGIRAAMGKGLRRWLGRTDAAIVGLQEVRAFEHQIDEHRPALRSFHTAFHAAERAGYSGVALLSRPKPDALVTALGEPAFDVEGRFQLARFGELVVVNAYFPNGNGKERDLSRVPYKLAFYRKVFDLLEAEKQRGAPILVMGDFNTAHLPIDLARPKDNVKNSGFLPEEREELDRWLRAGWIDTFRRFEPGPGHYSWWTQRLGARGRNIGWRIDYVLASPGAEAHLRGAFIEANVIGSDHAPVGVDVDDAILGERAGVILSAPAPVAPAKAKAPRAGVLTEAKPLKVVVRKVPAKRAPAKKPSTTRASATKTPAKKAAAKKAVAKGPAEKKGVARTAAKKRIAKGTARKGARA